MWVSLCMYEYVDTWFLMAYKWARFALLRARGPGPRASLSVCLRCPCDHGAVSSGGLVVYTAIE